MKFLYIFCIGNVFAATLFSMQQDTCARLNEREKRNIILTHLPKKSLLRGRILDQDSSVIPILNLFYIAMYGMEEDMGKSCVVEQIEKKVHYRKATKEECTKYLWFLAHEKLVRQYDPSEDVGVTIAEIIHGECNKIMHLEFDVQKIVKESLRLHAALTKTYDDRSNLIAQLKKLKQRLKSEQ